HHAEHQHSTWDAFAEVEVEQLVLFGVQVEVLGQGASFERGHDLVTSCDQAPKCLQHLDDGGVGGDQHGDEDCCQDVHHQVPRLFAAVGADGSDHEDDDENVARKNQDGLAELDTGRHGVPLKLRR